ncbi:MAG: hypothetical protein LBQ86_00615, partial [Holophagales bacterium]|nr:hypothetical protein [Holophagales bacterium]
IELLLNKPIVALEILADMPQLSEDALPVCERALKNCLILGTIQSGLEIISSNIVEMAKRGLGDFAKQALYNALGIQPIPEYWLVLAEIAHQNGARDERIESLKYVLSLLAPDDPRYDSVRKMLLSLGVSPEALNIKGPPDVMGQGDNQEQGPKAAGLDPRRLTQARHLLKEAKQLEDSAKHDKALETYLQILEIDPANLDVIKRVAEIYKSTGMLTKAQAHLIKAAEVLAALGKSELALKCLDKAEELIPGSTRVARLMLESALAAPPAPAGDALIQLDISLPPLDGVETVKLPPLALDAASQASNAIPPLDFEAVQALPVIEMDEPEQFPAAITPVSVPETPGSAWQTVPLNDFALPPSNITLPDFNEPAPTQDAIGDALRDALVSIDFQLDYASPADAKIEIEKALTIYHDHPELLKRLERVKEKLSQPGAVKEPQSLTKEHAFLDISDLLDLSFDSPQGSVETSDDTQAVQQIQSAEEIYNAFRDEVAQQVGGDDYDTHYNLGIGYKEMLLFEPAVEAFKKAMRDPERTLECCSMLALCEANRGNVDAAIEWLRKGIDDPGFPPADSVGLRQDLVVLLQRAGRHQEAQAQLQEVQRLSGAGQFNQ